MKTIKILVFLCKITFSCSNKVSCFISFGSGDPSRDWNGHPWWKRWRPTPRRQRFSSRAFEKPNPRTRLLHMSSCGTNICHLLVIVTETCFYEIKNCKELIEINSDARMVRNVGSEYCMNKSTKYSSILYTIEDVIEFVELLMRFLWDRFQQNRFTSSASTPEVERVENSLGLLPKWKRCSK